MATDVRSAANQYLYLVDTPFEMEMFSTFGDEDMIRLENIAGRRFLDGKISDGIQSLRKWTDF